MRVARSKHVTVVYNPVKVDLGRLRRAVERSVWPGAKVTWSATSTEDPGCAQASRALEDGADLLVAAGGDGTVRMVALAVSGSQVPMAIVPAGTGNMLARNLGIPLALEPAVRRAFSGQGRVTDLCRAELTYPDGCTEQSGFAVMAGVGVDAGMIHRTRESLKAAVGPLAYVPAVFQSLGGGNSVRVSITLDDAPPVTTDLHTCIAGNFSELVGHIPLLPDARPDDGLLNAVILRAEDAADWAGIGGKLVLDTVRGGVRALASGDGADGASPAPRSMQYIDGRSLALEFAEPEELELDGDAAGAVTAVRFEVDPGALRVVC